MTDSRPDTTSSGARQSGNDRPPDITRKVTACVACRKQKIRCNLRETGSPCSRCKKRGLSCTVNRSLQMILESDGAWKMAMEHRISNMESALSRVSTELRLPALHVLTEGNNTSLEPRESASTTDQTPPYVAKHTPHSFELVMDPNSGPAAIPGSVVSQVADARDTAHAEQDVISRGVVSREEAQSFLDVYQDRLDHFLYRILGDRRTLQQLRSSSPLLLVAISAVGALHATSAKFDDLFKEFVTSAASLSFSRRCGLDEIRALCIAAFWLSSISWTCIGSAVRLCSEQQLHRSIFKAMQGDHQHYLRTRLYYLVYVCDHQFSVAFGRPPMTREDDAISASMEFLKLDNCTEDDARLVSQVEFWTVGSEIYQAFGVNVDKPLDGSAIGYLRRLGIKLDKIRTDWILKFSVNQYVGNYPKKGVSLHYHFARLYLCSMAFRGIDRPTFKTADIELDIDEIADTALLSATAILRTVISDTEIQSYLNGLPTYFDVMIAFAAVFLIKVSTKHTSTVRVDVAENHSLIDKLANVLQTVTASMHPRHLLVSVAKGIGDLLQRASHAECRQGARAGPEQCTSQLNSCQSQNEHAASWPDISLDEFMGEFDFLADQGTWTGE